MTVATIADVLGGRKTLHATIQTEPELRELTRKGLPVDTIGSLAKELKLPEQQIAKLAGISSRTFSRRRTHGTRLTLSASDRLVQLASVLAYGAEVLGSSDAAAKWIQHPNRALGGEVPLDLMDTSTGAEEVRTILGRIAYGIFS